MEWWNGGKLPQILKGGMAMIESHLSKTRRIRINDNPETTTKLGLLDLIFFYQYNY